MMTKQTETAKAIIQNIGGKENIESLSHCFTRLRFNLKDNHKLNQAAIEQIQAVKGCTVNDGQLQIIIGTGVENYYQALIELTGSQLTAEKTVENKGLMTRIIDVITAIFIPVFPALAAGGLLKGLLIALQFSGLVNPAGETFTLLMMMSDIPFYFLPIILAFSSAKRFGANQYLALLVAGALLHPTFTSLEASTSFLGITVPHISYSSTVFPILLCIWGLSFVEKFFKKIIPELVSMLFVPLLSILVMIPVALIAVGPFANWLGELVGSGVIALYNTTGLFGGAVFGAIYPLLVFTGLHQAIPPIELQNLAQTGTDMLLALCAVANASVAGTTMMNAVKTRSKEFKSVAYSAGVSAVIGITEPAIYGVVAKSKKNFIASMIGGGIGGAIVSFFKVAAVGMGPVPLAGIALFAGDTFIYYIIGIVVAFASAAIAVQMLGVEESSEAQATNHSTLEVNEVAINSPLTGEVIPLSEIQDPTFSSGVMGDGIAIIPTEGRLVSPITGEVTAIFPSKHAIGLKNDAAEVIIHVGIDTVKLKGQPFETFVNVGDQVNEGELLLTFDLAAIIEKGFDPATAIIVSNSGDFSEIKKYRENEAIQFGQPLLMAVR